jgi:hypothetical protein
MENPTDDLSNFGYREKAIAGKLLSVYADNPPDFLGDGVKVWLNSNSGYVFLCDEDYNVGVLNDDDTKIIQFFSCPNCGNEGTDAEEGGEYEFNKFEGYCCKKCLKQ